MLAHSAFLGSGWANEGYLNSLPQRQRYHQRASSGSSVASAGPPSPLDHTFAYPHIASSDSSHFSPSYDFDYLPSGAHPSKSLPTPVDTPTSNAFMSSGYHNNAAQDANGYAPTTMRRIQQASGTDDDYGFSGQSVSTMSHNSPATPHTNYDVDLDDAKNMYHGKKISVDTWMDEYLYPDAGYPSAAFSQAMQDVFPDQGALYTPTTSSFQSQLPQNYQRLNNHFSPRRTMLANRLQVVNQDHISARTNSPITSIPRDKSPFRQSSPYVEQLQINQQSPRHLKGMQVQARPLEAPKSVSPKELMLDDNEVEDTNATPLFAQQSDSMFSGRRQTSSLSNFQFAPTFSQTPPVQIPQQYPFVSSQPRQDNSLQAVPDPTPEFPAHIASMESTIEEGPSSDFSSQEPLKRPEDTSSDAGTYTCTYHGCTVRFETPAKLQKHKREAHRPTSPTSPAQSAALRNSQAGPHKCERTNPTTGKPCNSIFSRPYDLTRHEDTIHNARKQKVRCHLCTEEKTFSRNDALTRHMRVVHPDVDWPGKVRKNARRD